MNEQGREPALAWWQRHRSVATIAGAALIVAAGGLFLLLHAATSEGGGTLPHGSGDAAFFGVFAVLVLLGAAVIVSYQRRA